MEESSGRTQPLRVVDVTKDPSVLEPKDFEPQLLPLEKVATYLATALFVVITLVVALVAIDWLLHRPAEPSLAGLKPEDQKLAIENFKLVSEIVWDRTSKTFDLIVIKALLPVFATIVGYLLGKRS